MINHRLIDTSAPLSTQIAQIGFSFGKSFVNGKISEISAII